MFHKIIFSKFEHTWQSYSLLLFDQMDSKLIVPYTKLLYHHETHQITIIYEMIYLLVPYQNVRKVQVQCSLINFLLHLKLNYWKIIYIFKKITFYWINRRKTVCLINFKFICQCVPRCTKGWFGWWWGKNKISNNNLNWF